MENYLGKAVKIKPKSKGIGGKRNSKLIGYIIDRDPSNNTYLIYFSETNQFWSKLENMEFLEESKAKFIDIEEFDADEFNFTPKISVGPDTIFIKRPKFSDEETVAEFLKKDLLGPKTEEEKSLDEALESFNYGFKTDIIHKSPHYNHGKIEAIDVIEDWGLNFSQGNILKYLCRAGKKSGEEFLKDLKKMQYYVNREVSRLERK